MCLVCRIRSQISNKYKIELFQVLFVINICHVIIPLLKQHAISEAIQLVEYITIVICLAYIHTYNNTKNEFRFSREILLIFQKWD
jgi:hypothetical protein